MTIENQIRAIAGSIILISLFLAYFFSGYWLWVTAFFGVNLLQSSFTGFCLMEKILRKVQNQPQ